MAYQRISEIINASSIENIGWLDLWIAEIEFNNGNINRVMHHLVEAQRKMDFLEGEERKILELEIDHLFSQKYIFEKDYKSAFSYLHRLAQSQNQYIKEQAKNQ